MFIPETASTILQALEDSGHSAYVVGGYVRDSIAGNVSHDIDICTSATPDEIKLSLGKYRIIETGIKHGTVTVVIGEDKYEVTTFRADGKYSDGRHPDSIAFVRRVEDDLARRDFTVNAMAWNPRSGLIDLFDGLSDTTERLIRCVGDPGERFKEDGLRILRALRFASQMNFSIDPETAKAIRCYRDLLSNISAERIAMEFNKILLGAGAKKVLDEYAEIIAVFIPEITPSIGFLQRNKHHYLPVWEHTTMALVCSVSSLPVKLALFFHDLGKPKSFTQDENGEGHFYGHPVESEAIALSVMKRLKYDNDTIDAVCTLVRYHDAKIAPTSKSVKRMLNHIGEELFRQLIEVKKADASAHIPAPSLIAEIENAEMVLGDVIKESQCFTLKQLNVNGYDIMSLGIKEGKIIGLMLNMLLSEVIDNGLENEKRKLINRVQEYIINQR